MSTVVYLGAGLANRMFQYAFAVSLRARGIDVKIDEHSFIPTYDFENIKIRDVFSNIDIQESTSDLSFHLKKGRVFKLLHKITELLPNRRIIERWTLDYIPNIYDKNTKDCVFIGFWISYKYFSDFKNIISDSFKFRPLVGKKNQDIFHDIISSESVAVHFRKNVDYQKNLPNTCPPEYYYKAINLIRKNIINPRFYFFSDNWDWVKRNIKGIDYIPVDWNSNSGNDSYIDMQLMCNCKHIITANSTYSWWAAFLNCNPNKIVCVPQDWFGNMLPDLKDIIPSDWYVENKDF